jgi:hypothetical protein
VFNSGRGLHDFEKDGPRAETCHIGPRFFFPEASGRAPGPQTRARDIWTRAKHRELCAERSVTQSRGCYASDRQGPNIAAVR